LRGEGHSVTGWGTGGSDSDINNNNNNIAADCGFQSPFVWAMSGR